MALLNYSVPYLATPHPPAATSYYQPPQQHGNPFAPPQNSYSYPVPQKPFLSEEYPGYHQKPPNAAATNPFHAQNTPPNLPYPPAAQNTQHNLPYPSGAQNTRGPYPPAAQPSEQVQPTFTKVTDDGTKTKVHAVIDYDDYEDDDEQLHPAVTPIQGPIFIKNGSVPVVPLYSHPVLNNGSFVQIPILWTALSVALGLELRGEYIRGVPCIKRNQQLYCPTAGNSYPLDKIETFIDENKALMKRMYGEFDMPEYEPGTSAPGAKKKRSTKPGVPDIHFDPGPDPETSSNTFEKKKRTPRQNINFKNNVGNESGRIDACESKVEIVTPYWASNSAGKVRAIVNTQHFEQAIHQEVCAKSSTKRCSGECGCEQKYKWHRLLAYDPDNDCKGIFMDWFLFPSCCVCRCDPT